MNIAVIIILVLLLGAGRSATPTPPGTPGCVGCCPGTSTYEGMLKAKAILISKYGTWDNTPTFPRIVHTIGYGQCPGYSDF